jgi:2,3-diketo-5-methylthio-1-phosphopentane phosphatase
VVFDDVPAALARWQAAGLSTRIYSSGSIEAQKLLFAHSTAGDLTPHLCGYFDTTTGPKREAASYEKIARDAALDAHELLFLTDVVEEAQAARDAGLQAAIMDRPGNRPQPAHDFVVLSDFEQL